MSKLRIPLAKKLFEMKLDGEHLICPVCGEKMVWCYDSKLKKKNKYLQRCKVCMPDEVEIMIMKKEE